METWRYVLLFVSSLHPVQTKHYSLQESFVFAVTPGVVRSDRLSLLYLLRRTLVLLRCDFSGATRYTPLSVHDRTCRGYRALPVL